MVADKEGVQIVSTDEDEEVAFWTYDRIEKITGQDDDDPDNLDQLEIDVIGSDDDEILTFAFECENFRPIVLAVEQHL